MQTVVIVGVGLIGGSFALALRKAGFSGAIVGVSSPETLRQAVDLGVIDEGAPLEEAAPRADLVYLAQPIRKIIQVLPALNVHLRPGALVTDAGSTKVEIVAQAGRSIRRNQFLGGHPMAGKEVRGVAAAEAELFRDRTYFFTPTQTSEMETDAARELLEWIRRIGALPVLLKPDEHDRVVACTSHLPQLLSTALASLLAERRDLPEIERAAGPGLLDNTRLALSAYEIWSDILVTNSAPIEHALDICIRKLEQIRAELTAPELEQEFEIASNFARRLRRGIQKA